MTASLRIFFFGGITSYRALFHWLTPWILIPTFVIEPIFQVLFFAYVGRDAGVGSDSFYLIGNAVQFAAIPCLFAMGNTIGNERYTQTLGLLLASPARRLPLFLGRALPVIVNGFCVSLVVLVLGALVLRVHIPGEAWVPIVGVLVVTSFACTGLGLATAALALRVRETATLSNIIIGVLIVFCGVNVPLSALPTWMSTIAYGLPLTHGIEAARDLAGGATWSSVTGLVSAEALIGVVYAALGLAMLFYFEGESRRHATLELA
jgi:ABC-2 type transport system permease protein